MFRALLELVITIIVAMAGRAIIASLMKSMGNAAAQAGNGGFKQQSPPQPQPTPEAKATGELHKDPVCGTYVSNATTFQRRVGGQTFYYCSEACRQKHVTA